MARKTITVDLANVTCTSNTASVDSEIIDIEVPRGFAYEVKPGTPIELFLYTRCSLASAASVSTLSSPDYSIMHQSGFQEKSTVARDATDCFVVSTASLVDSAGGLKNQGSYYVIYSVSGVSCVTMGTARDACTVYYMPYDYQGKLEIRKMDAQKEAFTTLFRDKLIRFRDASPYQANTIIRLDNGFTVGPQEHIIVRLNSPIVYTFDSFIKGRGANLRLEVESRPVK